MFMPSATLWILVISNTLSIFDCVFIPLIPCFISDCFYSSRIIEAGDHSIQIRPLSAKYRKRNPMFIDSSIFAGINVDSKNCSTDDVREYCVKWNDTRESILNITRLDRNCEKFEWRTEFSTHLMVAFDLEGVQLYGGAEGDFQCWPIQNNMFSSTYRARGRTSSQAVLEPYWLDSGGQYIIVDEKVPLYVTYNETTLILQAMNRVPPYMSNRGLYPSETFLKFTVCSLEDVKMAHQHAIENAFQKPTKVPDFRMIQYPIWSTWAAYKSQIDEKKVLEYANEIVKYGFPNSALEIDDEWETCYGSLTVNTTKFPNMRQLVSSLHERGFRVTLWVHPFINTDCHPFFEEARDSKYFVKNSKGFISTHWWNGEGATVDFTNPNASKWWVNRLKSLQNETGIDSFKFDAGESDWIMGVPVYETLPDDNPDNLVKAYVETANQFGNMIEVRVGKGTQKISPVVRMINRETAWTGMLSLQSLIPTLLQMNVVGYPFVMPDMIGGNEYSSELTEELYIRWLQASTFMPILQFSIPPWRFGPRAINITKKFIDLHAKYANVIHKLMVKATRDGTPVNLPIWWVDPFDNRTYNVDSQYMLGEHILVAPILQENVTLRSIYLPTGLWQDENRPDTGPLLGPCQIGYKADLNVLPYFTRYNECPW